MGTERKKIHNDIQSYFCLESKANNKKKEHCVKSIQLQSIFWNDVAHFYSPLSRSMKAFLKKHRRENEIKS